MITYTTFDSWPDLIAHIRAGGAVAYHAPLDYRPIAVQVQLRMRGDKVRAVRVYPNSSDADPFNADSGHLPRFRRITND